MQDPSLSLDHYKQIAHHYASVKDYPLAEEYYLKAEMAQDAVEMYIKANQWENAYKIAVSCMAQEEVRQLYVSRARELEEQGKLREAEKMYVIVEEHDLAISMYKRHKQVWKRGTEAERRT